MKVTVKGQVTIPQAIREKLGIKAYSEVDFVEDKNGRIYLKRIEIKNDQKNRFRTIHKLGKLTMSTEEIMQLTRE